MWGMGDWTDEGPRDLGDNGVAEVVLARTVDFSTTTQLLLECRLHEKSISAAGA